ncbi:MAG: pantoate--beta-alanine ligase, partial [Thermoguttaceae bacterium]
PADLDALAAIGSELVFAPGNEEMYPKGYCTWVDVGTLAEPLEGQCRSGHFRGVATIVLKLLEIVRPDAAFFGQKDYQQALVIRRMVKDLNVPVEIRLCPTVREPDGLALSSRNRYLSPGARQRALVLWKSLKLAEDLLSQGERSAEKIVDQMRKVILTAEDARIDYVALVDPESLQPVLSITGRTLAALAVTIENTRLIDNCLLEI